MRLESDAEVAVGFVVVATFVIMMATALVSLYHYGYYEGKSVCQSDTNTVLQKALIKETK